MAREGLESAEFDDTKTNGQATYDEHPLRRRSPRDFVGERCEMGRGPFENVSDCLIFSHPELLIDRIAGGKGVGNPRRKPTYIREKWRSTANFWRRSRLDETRYHRRKIQQTSWLRSRTVRCGHGEMAL